MFANNVGGVAIFKCHHRPVLTVDVAVAAAAQYDYNLNVD